MNCVSSLVKYLVPAFITLSASAALATTAVGPDLGTVHIKKITAAGTGCPDQSTFSTNISPDAQAFTVTFSQFVAEVGPGIPLSSARKNCSLTLTLNIPNGWQYTVGTFNYRGFMDLGAKVQAVHTTQYFFQGTGSTGSFSATETGVMSKDFVYTDKIGLTTTYIPLTTWSPCNVERALTINPSIRLQKLPDAAADAQGLITNDSVDGEMKQVFGFQWRRC